MKNEIRYILGDIQEIISNNLKIDKITEKGFINESLLYDIIFLIEENLNSQLDINNGVEIYRDKWTNRLNLGYNTILRHIDWLVKYRIIWRSNLTFTPSDKGFKNDIRRYNIHKDIIINNYQRFVYTTYKDFNKIQNILPIIDSETKSNIYLNLLKISIDLESALKTIYNIDMKYKGKKQQSFYTYQIAFQKFNIIQKSDEKRVFHTITSLSSELHKDLYIDNQQVSEIDARQSQLVLLSLITKNIDDSFYNDVHSTYIYDDIVKYWKTKIEKEIFITNKNIKFRYYDDKDKITKYIEHYNINKNIIKPLVYASLFSGFNDKNYNPVTEYFKQIYPKLVEYIKANYPKENSLSNKLQTFEASIWVTAFNKLSKNGIHCIIKHDAILFKQEDEYDVLSEVIKQYKINGLTINKRNIDKYLDININTKRIDKPFVKPTLIIIDDFETEYKETQTEIQTEIQRSVGNTDLTEYTFIHKDGSTFTGIKSDFASKFNLDKKNLNKVITGKSKSIKGWSLKS